jgi:hypothetical protein
MSHITRHPRVALLRVRGDKVDASVGKDKRKTALNEIMTGILAENVSGLAQADFLHFAQRNRSNAWRKVLQ